MSTNLEVTAVHVHKGIQGKTAKKADKLIFIFKAQLIINIS